MASLQQQVLAAFAAMRTSSNAPADAEMNTRGWKAFQRTAYTAIVCPLYVALYLQSDGGVASG